LSSEFEKRMALRPSDPRADLRIPDALFEKANKFPEWSYGATKVTLILADGRRVENVILGGAEWIVKVGDRLVTEATELDFAVGEIVDVIPQRSHPSLWRSCLEALRAAMKH
jgi:hypothetical protein